MRRPTLAEQTNARLRAAGFTYHDPALIALRQWNEGAAALGRISVETRRGQFGKTRRVTLAEAERPRQPVTPHPATTAQARKDNPRER